MNLKEISQRQVDNFSLFATLKAQLGRLVADDLSAGAARKCSMDVIEVYKDVLVLFDGETNFQTITNCSFKFSSFPAKCFSGFLF